MGWPQGIEGAAGGDAGEGFATGSLDREPRIRLQVAPVYPLTERREGREGTVILALLVDPQGNVLQASSVHADTPGFAEAAVRAVRQWKFESGTRSGVPVGFRMSLPLHFSLDD